MVAVLDRLAHPVAGLVRQVQLALHGVKGHPRLLCHQLHVHGFVWLQADHELVATGSRPLGRPKDVPRDILELYANFSLTLVQSCQTREMVTVV